MGRDEDERSKLRALAEGVEISPIESHEDETDSLTVPTADIGSGESG
jgi:hypothetical protein